MLCGLSCSPMDTEVFSAFRVLILSSVYLDDSMLKTTISVSCPNPKSEVNFSCSSGSYSFPLCLRFFFPCILPFANLV